MSDRGALTIKRLDSTQPDQVARWEAFVAACPKATFFHRAGWQTVIRDVFRHPTYFLFAEQDGEMLGDVALRGAHGVDDVLHAFFAAAEHAEDLEAKGVLTRAPKAPVRLWRASSMTA